MTYDLCITLVELLNTELAFTEQTGQHQITFFQEHIRTYIPAFISVGPDIAKHISKRSEVKLL